MSKDKVRREPRKPKKEKSPKVPATNAAASTFLHPTIKPSK